MQDDKLIVITDQECARQIRPYNGLQITKPLAWFTSAD